MPNYIFRAALPFAFASIRSIFASLLIWAVLRKPNIALLRDQVLCALAYVATVTIYIVANQLTAAANVILLQYTAPIYVALFGLDAFIQL